MDDAGVTTGGGAAIPGNVEAGTFIGRDQIIVISGYTGEDLEQALAQLQEILGSGRGELCTDAAKGRLTVRGEGSQPLVVLSSDAARDLLPVAARQPDEQAYLTALIVNPRYGRWSTQFVPLAGVLTVSECPPGWHDFPPEFTLLEVCGEGSGKQVRRVQLDDITQAMQRYAELVLLGEPGSGKTTTLYRLALEAAQQRLVAGEGKVPLYLSLADYRAYDNPYDFVDAQYRHLLGGDAVADRLRQGDLFLLCDALNEMPFDDERDYRSRVGAWQRFVRDWPGNQVLFTCRSRDYSEPLGLQQVEIDPLDNPRIKAFLEKYLPPEQAAEAWARLDGAPLLALMRNPYYLSMLAFILARDEMWPDNRAALFQGFVQALLDRERQRHHPEWLDAEALCCAYSLLAEEMQPLGAGTRLAPAAVLTCFPDSVTCAGRSVATSPEALLHLGLSATLLDTELGEAGEQVRFYHHQLQEYFAACALVDRFQKGESLAARWRQPRLVREMGDPGPLGDDEPLPPPPTTGWEEPTVLAAGLASDPAAFVAAVQQVNPVLAARCLDDLGAAALPDAARAVRALLLRDMENPEVHLRARIAAGEMLGHLGDPRFKAGVVEGQRVLLPPLVPIPAGTFRMGSSAWEVWRLKRRGIPADDEQPRHPVTLPDFYIGQFPVTNAEYGCFVAAGGYAEARYWATEAAQGWLRGDVEDGVVQQVMDTWRTIKEDPSVLEQAQRSGWTPRVIAAWGQALKFEEAAFLDLVKNIYGNRSLEEPAFWNDGRYNSPGQPVVGVNWYEARAYCAWLTERVQRGAIPLQRWRAGQLEPLDLPADRALVQLPSEAQWERAARGGRGGRYPWGNRWEAGRANTWEGHLLRPSPVGCYPQGVTAEDVSDMSGDVWEWTRSLYQAYPYCADDGREDVKSSGELVLRGGSWGSNQWSVRCAFCSRSIPEYFDLFSGFRVVGSLWDSDF